MKVVRINPDRSVTLLGWCRTFAWVKGAGDFVTIHEPPPFGVSVLSDDTDDESVVRIARFSAVYIRSGYESEIAIEAKPDGPPPEWLPGWCEAPP